MLTSEALGSADPWRWPVPTLLFSLCAASLLHVCILGLALNAVLMIEEQTQKCRWCKKLKVSHFRILNMSLDSNSDYAGQFRGVFKKKKGQVQLTVKRSPEVTSGGEHC